MAEEIDGWVTEVNDRLDDLEVYVLKLNRKQLVSLGGVGLVATALLFYGKVTMTLVKNVGAIAGVLQQAATAPADFIPPEMRPPQEPLPDTVPETQRPIRVEHPVDPPYDPGPRQASQKIAQELAEMGTVGPVVDGNDGLS